MSETRYNGWANRPTWNAHLWLMNDESSSRDVMTFVRLGLGQAELASVIEAYAREMFDGGATPDGDNLDAVNWRDIARAVVEV